MTLELTMSSMDKPPVASKFELLPHLLTPNLGLWDLPRFLASQHEDDRAVAWTIIY